MALRELLAEVLHLALQLLFPSLGIGELGVILSHDINEELDLLLHLCVHVRHLLLCLGKLTRTFDKCSVEELDLAVHFFHFFLLLGNGGLTLGQLIG